mmetsp:Transcript_4957/g.8660  ORF Transcript_4957/g.8660 Transcript_4957/m.8660 type:complete len:503 (+) Transcript_4957:23-1531(+)
MATSLQPVASGSAQRSARLDPSDGRSWPDPGYRPSLPSTCSFRSGITSVIIVTRAEEQGAAQQVGNQDALASLISTLGSTVPHSNRIQPWPATSALMVAEVVGTGVLALGGAFSKLGWVFGFAVLTWGYIINVFTSLLLNSVHLAMPDVVTVGDALDRLMGRQAGIVGYFVLYTYIFLVMSNYLIVLATAVQSVFYSTLICRSAAAAIGCALLLPGNQFRTLAGLTTLSGISFLTILITIAVCLWTLSETSAKGGAVCKGGAAEGDDMAPGFLDYNAAACAFIFAYSGQAIMLEMQAEMKAPADFPKAVWCSFSTLMVVYALVASAAFYVCGAATPGELLDVLPNTPRQTAVGILMVIHLIVTYTILQQVITRAVCLHFWPHALGQGVKARAVWCSTSTGIMGAAYIVANTIPLFSDIVNITGGLLSTQVGFIFPSSLYLALQRYHPELVSAGCRRFLMSACCCAALCMGLYFTFVGTVSSVALMAQHAADGVNAPFTCSPQ